VRKRLVVAGAILAALSLVVAACSDDGGDATSGGGNEPEESSAEPQTGGTLRYGLEADGDGLNPAANRFAIASTIMGRAVFDTLAAWNEDGEAEPYLAKSFTPNDDFTTWDVELRPDIEFHDGTPLTSEALAVGTDALLADPLLSLVTVGVLDDQHPYDIIDELTIRYYFLIPVPNYPAYLTTQVGTVASPTWVQAAEQDPSLNQEPVGTGPFRFESRVVGQETKFVRNDDYWRDGYPYLDRITFRIVTDPQTRAAALEAGDLDVIHTTRAADIADFRDDPDVKSYEDTEGEEGFILLNTAAEPFDDPRAREALALATDRESYIDLLGEGITQVANSMFSPDSRWYSDEVTFPEYDAAAAADLAADYCADHADNCNGDRIAFTLGSTPSAENQLITDTLTSFWSDAFDVTVANTEQASFITGAATGDYQANLWRQYGALDPDLDYAFLHSDSIDPGLAINFARLDDPEIDELLQEQRSEENFQTRKEIWAQIGQEINAYLPYIWLNHTIWAVVTQTDVQSINDWELPDGQPGFPQYNGAHMLYQVWMGD
jgi:peptide/nickel transport system substrate-binding protein